MSKRRLRVDPVICDGHGICAELVPDLIRLDDWGYPIVEGTPIPAALLDEVRHAITACPLLALRLEKISPVGSGTVSAGRQRGA